ncbi:UNVERIFIED_CONTAM: hypothetical protein PYX00_009579 [Menopon gallinae]
MIHFDSFDETASHKSGSTNAGKREGKPRAKTKPYDYRWNYVGNGRTDPKWEQNGKLEVSQSDLGASKWVNADGKSDFGQRSPGSNSSESVILSTRSIVSSNPNESSYTRPQPLFKSSSSSQITSIRNNYAQSKQWKCAGNSTTRPMSVASYQCNPQTAWSTGLHPSGRIYCGCDSIRKTGNAESVLSLTEDHETPEGLSWRRLHMSRAKLKATATTSELLSGFAMVAMVELQINKPTAVPEWLFVLFAVCTTVLVSVHIFALMISTYLLPNIDAVSKLHVSSLVTESPHDRMKGFIELAWAFSTILGLFLFLVEIAILCWVKFWDYSFTAAMSATMIVIPVLIIFVAFAMHFYHSLVVIKCKTSVTNIQELENMKKQLDVISGV